MASLYLPDDVTQDMIDRYYGGYDEIEEPDFEEEFDPDWESLIATEEVA